MVLGFAACLAVAFWLILTDVPIIILNDHSAFKAFQDYLVMLFILNDHNKFKAFQVYFVLISKHSAIWALLKKSEINEIILTKS